MLIIISLIYLFLSSPLYAQSPTIDPSITPTLTLTPTPTATLTLTPTPTSSVAKNPSTGIYLNEFMPNPTPTTASEWIEIYNSNDFEVQLIGWKIGDLTTSTRPSSGININIPAHGVKDIDIGTDFLNNSTDLVKLINDKGETVDSYTYPKISVDGYSWSKVNGSWCFAVLSKGQGNNSCASPASSPTPTSTVTPTNTPTPTKKPTPTPTIDLNKYPTTTPPVPVIEPTGTDEEMHILGESANIEETTPGPTSNLKLEDTTKKTKSNNILPGIFIGVGGLMLLAPLILAKLKHEKQ